jgi:nicotinamidase-related amidase
MLESAFFDHCAFVSVDIQETNRPALVTDGSLPDEWRAMGFTADDVNAANAFAYESAFPNALKVAEACLRLKLPRIFIHWGFQYTDGMDLDPVIRQAMLKNHGGDATRWSGYIQHPESQPAIAFGIHASDYVLPKTAQDAFISSHLGFVLANLDVRNLILVGGHTEACLGKTAASARRIGFHTCCIHDATNNARESTRMKGIEESRFHHVIATQEFLRAVEHRGAARQG